MNMPLLSPYEDPETAAEFVELDGCQVEVDNAACSVDDAVNTLVYAIARIVELVDARPDLARDHLPRLRDQHDQANAAFNRGRAAIVARCERHNEDELQRRLAYLGSI